MNVRVCTCALIMLLWPVARGLNAGERLSLTLSSTQAFAPASLFVQVRLEPDADNRSLEIVAESAEFYRSSAIDVDGERAPRVLTMNLRNLPSGDYEVRGVLMDAAGNERACTPEVEYVVASPSAQ